MRDQDTPFLPGPRVNGPKSCRRPVESLVACVKVVLRKSALRYPSSVSILQRETRYRYTVEN